MITEFAINPAVLDPSATTTLTVPGDEGYDAVRDTGRRRPPRSRLRSEDRTLMGRDRDRMQATTRDVRRNFALAAWAIRMHLNYVASFSFHPQNEDQSLNQRLIDWEKRISRREDWELSRRHPRRRWTRIMEALRIVDGDVFAYRTNTGRIQGIEGDRVRTSTHDIPRDVDIDQWTHGVRVGGTGEPRAYMISRRGRSGQGFEFATILPAGFVWPHGCYDRLDQVRGVSPLAAAINSLQDVYEGVDYALARAKVSQLFALAIYSTSEPDAGELELDGESAEGDERYKVDVTRGPSKLELEPGDRAEFLESRQPSNQFREFMVAVIQIALKSLDIPYSFFDESHTNFFGSKGALIHYLKSAREKREDIASMLEWITRWRLRLAVADGEFDLPSGMSADDVRWEWIPDGVPWWDVNKEVTGHAAAIASGLENFERVTQEAGTGDVRENIRINAEIMRFAEQEGFPITLPGVFGLQPTQDTDERAGAQ